MTQYEYKTVTVPANVGEGSAADKALNALGADGWLLVSLFPVPVPPTLDQRVAGQQAGLALCAALVRPRK